MKLTDLLKTETRVLHDEVEVLMESSKIIDGSLSKEEYIRLIQILYDFHSRYEKKALDEVYWMPYEKYAKLPLLERDRDLLDIAILNTSGDPANKLGFQKAIGFCYVIQGASLGGQMIVRKLNTNPSLKDIQEFNYYTGYADDTGKTWKAFKDKLDALELDSEARQQTVAGAKEAFEEIRKLALTYQTMIY